MAKKPPHPGGPRQTAQDDARGSDKRGSPRSPDHRPSSGRYTTSDGSDVWDLDMGKDRPEWMVSIRESDEHDQMMFDGMRDQTYQLLRHLPFMEQVRRAGMEPMAADGSFELEVAEGDVGSRRAVQVRRLRRGNTTVIVFRYGPAVHVWCMASAAKIHNDDRINDFTWLLMELVLAYRPRNVFTANLSRVIRSLEQAGLLLHALVGNVDAIWHGSQRLALAGPEASTGKFQYNMLASFAAMERVAILQRLMAGRVARFRMGRWVPGRNLVPPGYVLDAKTGLLEVDERQRETIAAAVDDDGSRHWLVQRARRSSPTQDGSGPTVTLHRCRCGERITGIVDCPEVPARLLCQCRRMPFAEAFGMDPGTRLPADYLRAIASPEDCRQYLARERPQPLRLGSGEVAVLSSAIFDNDVWVTVAQIADTVTPDADRVSGIMRRLETKGLAERHDTGKFSRWNPRLWRRLRTLDEIEFDHHGR